MFKFAMAVSALCLAMVADNPVIMAIWMVASLGWFAAGVIDLKGPKTAAQ